jgi:hypothetical protein
MLRSLPITVSESGWDLGVISAKNSQSPSLLPLIMPESDLPLSRDELCGQTVTLGLCLVFRDCCFLKRIYSLTWQITVTLSNDMWYSSCFKFLAIWH